MQQVQLRCILRASTTEICITTARSRLDCFIARERPRSCRSARIHDNERLLAIALFFFFHDSRRAGPAVPLLLLYPLPSPSRRERPEIVKVRRVHGNSRVRARNPPASFTEREAARALGYFRRGHGNCKVEEGKRDTASERFSATRVIARDEIGITEWR